MENNTKCPFCKGNFPLQLGSPVFVIDRLEPKMYHKDEIIEYRITKNIEYVVLKDAGTFNACKFGTLFFKTEAELLKALNA